MASYILSDPNLSDCTHPEVIEAIMGPLRDATASSSSGTSLILTSTAGRPR